MALHPYFPRSPHEVLVLAPRGALAGLGIDGPCEPSADPESTLRTVDEPAEQAAARLVARPA